MVLVPVAGPGLRPGPLKGAVDHRLHGRVYGARKERDDPEPHGRGSPARQPRALGEPLRGVHRLVDHHRRHEEGSQPLEGGGVGGGADGVPAGAAVLLVGGVAHVPHDVRHRYAVRCGHHPRAHHGAESLPNVGGVRSVARLGRHGLGEGRALDGEEGLYVHAVRGEARVAVRRLLVVEEEEVLHRAREEGGGRGAADSSRPVGRPVGATGQRREGLMARRWASWADCGSGRTVAHLRGSGLAAHELEIADMRARRDCTTAKHGRHGAAPAIAKPWRAAAPTALRWPPRARKPGSQSCRTQLELPRAWTARGPGRIIACGRRA
mmetsp:Transcript_11256/g.38357  ORF Transcript_11256/g.38357 Transcript_11256/m.38357 type:complete len:323 (-) Transcript_11256:609-1577(-)